MPLSYCDYGEGNSDEDCAKFALKDGEKNECKKKNNENKCEEVPKKTGDEPDIEDESGSSKTDSDTEAGKTDKGQTSDNDNNGEGKQDTSKSTEGTTGENGKDNNVNFINAAFGLLLINYLLF